MREKLDQLVRDLLARGVRLDDAMKEFEKLFIQRALEGPDETLGDVADRLGVHRNTLTRKMAEYRLGRRAGRGA